MLKLESWLIKHVGVMLSSMLYPNTGLSWFIQAQKSNLSWWCHLFISIYYWIRSTTLSCLLILGPKRCLLCYLLMCDHYKYEKLVREFVSLVKSINMLKIVHKHPQAYWNLYPLLTDGLDLGQWTLSLGCLLVQMVAMPFSPVFIIW